MITLENIETLKKKINEKANKEIEKLSSTYKIIQSLQKYYPSIAERLEEIPFKLEYGKPAFWVKLNIDTFHEALALIENLEFYPLPLFSRKNGCLSIMENLEEENLLKDGDTNLGFMLIHYKSNNCNWKTTQEVEVRLELDIENTRTMVHLRLKIKNFSKTSITKKYTEDYRGRKIHSGFELGKTYQGKRIIWASGSPEYPNRFTEYFPHCRTMEDVRASYPIFE